MHTDDKLDTVLTFARLLATGSGESGVTPARRRSWIDARGAVTPAGRELAAVLRDQRDTRSAFAGCA